MGEMAEERRKAGASPGRKMEGQQQGGCAVRWEVFLPQVYVRVLLVEADDATRHIVAALLRKCGYRVAAASDGLKAWETLKENSHNIDLVLTEVELPSISGYGLLTMIMEHETCKNIPVIMMSSHDSINVVFKCMLKGAADFLIKPIRKNELGNLWQHVWRRHSPYGLPRVRYKHEDENLTQPENGANLGNNSASDHHRNCIVSLHTEKGRDTQFSCARPDLDAENEYIQNMQENVLPDCVSSSVVNDTRNHEDGVCDKLVEKLPLHESEAEGCTMDGNIRRGQNICQSKPSREVDLIGTMDKLSCSNHGLGNCSETQVDILDDARDKRCEPLLELTLRRHQSISTDNKEKDEFNMLNHSDSSAFSRYNRTASSPPLTSSGFRRHEFESCKDQILLHGTTSQHSCAPLNMSPLDVTSTIGGPPNQCGGVPRSHLGLLPIPVPISGTAYGLFSSYGPVSPPLLYAQSDAPVWSSKPANHEATHSSMSHLSDQETFSSRHHGDPCGENVPKHFYQIHKEDMCNTESLSERSHVTSVTDQSRSTLNSSRSHANSSGCGSVCDDGNENLTVTNDSRSTLESADRNGLFIHDESKQTSSHCSVLRQAALIKFRLKRKERCHEKVRYQSRKRLGVGRPQLDKQFVHQVQQST